jgi:hypothetical protein
MRAPETDTWMNGSQPLLVHMVGKSILSVGSEVWDGPLLVKVANVRSALTEGSGLKRCFCVVSDYFQGLVR